MMLDAPSWSFDVQEKWIETQNSLKKLLINGDRFKWTIPTKPEVQGGGESSRGYPSIACGTLVILDLTTLKICYEDYYVVKLLIPYVPGFLAFREAPVLLKLLEKMKKRNHPFYPQLLMVDGNGVLHPRGFGLACHLGVLADLPTIGVGKNLHHVDGLTLSRVKALLQDQQSPMKEVTTLLGDSGCILGAAMRPTEGSLKPIFISIGHCIALTTAIEVVKLTCRFRVPEPIRQADIRSKDYLRECPQKVEDFTWDSYV
ncbi:hypothetical protein Leryth_026877 [Lithospermum erythrorhizon]|nr:hypothetical protein Leryth_026877 [Lithospermum erythrorhizon]